MNNFIALKEVIGSHIVGFGIIEGQLLRYIVHRSQEDHQRCIIPQHRVRSHSLCFVGRCEDPQLVSYKSKQSYLGSNQSGGPVIWCRSQSSYDLLPKSYYL